MYILEVNIYLYKFYWSLIYYYIETWLIALLICFKSSNLLFFHIFAILFCLIKYLTVLHSVTLGLIHCSSLLLFYTPWIHQKTWRFSNVFRGYKKETPGCNGLIRKSNSSKKYGKHVWDNLKKTFEFKTWSFKGTIMETDKTLTNDYYVFQRYLEISDSNYL